MGNSKFCETRAGSSDKPRETGALLRRSAGHQDTSHLVDGGIDVVVHHHGVELARVRLLGRGGGEATFDLGRVVLPTLDQAPALLLP